MGTVEAQPPHPSTTTTSGSYDEDDISPIEEVRLTVTNTDDPALPVWTFRMWFLGIISCALLSFFNQFFSYRTEPLVITQITVQVATLPIGHFLATILPITKFRIPGIGSKSFSLNPGPFNMKEHVLISIFANAGSAFGNGSAYGVSIVTIIKAFYQRNISFYFSWLDSSHHYPGFGIWLGRATEKIRGGAKPTCGGPAPSFKSHFSGNASNLGAKTKTKKHIPPKGT